MLLVVLTIFSAVYGEGSVIDVKPCSIPVPLEFPNRNDRSEQCWLRIEDVELVETVTMYCYIANGFLRSYTYDYNSRKMTQDNVDVSLWSEEERPQEDISPKSPIGPKGVKDWRSTTVLDPITHMRVYVTKNADCRLIMYSREGMSNYKIDCESILSYVNEKMQSSAVSSSADFSVLFISILFLIGSINFS